MAVFSWSCTNTDTLYDLSAARRNQTLQKETYFEGEGLITTNKGQFSGKIVPKSI